MEYKNDFGFGCIVGLFVVGLFVVIEPRFATTVIKTDDIWFCTWGKFLALAPKVSRLYRLFLSRGWEAGFSAIVPYILLLVVFSQEKKIAHQPMACYFQQSIASDEFVRLF
mmetsp:Transcript_3880/g.8851  ORF Transcript_3880/g.8851 Transcript_3880/m.8851 type:complete len:111 (-) Transcript_3880:19-351(-)